MCISIYRTQRATYIRQGTVSLSLTERVICALTTADEYSVNEGNILNENGEVIEKLRLSYIPENADVTKVGNDLFSYDGDMTIPAGEKYDIIQGCFEKSNVDANKEITSLMETQRLFEASSAVLKYMDTINGRAASEIIKL